MADAKENPGTTFRVLAIDGGGSKGMFAIGALVELEKILDRTCKEAFDLVYGTSVGAIIATMIALGHDAETIEEWFLNEIPKIMRPKYAHQRSHALRRALRGFFGALTFQDVDMLLGVVATRTDFHQPMIFKASPRQAISGKQTFTPGWGARLSDALLGSCAAQPAFSSVSVPTDQGVVPVIDGGFVANNPCLFALIDAIHTLGHPREDVVALSVGVGIYPEPKATGMKKLLAKHWFPRLFGTVQSANANTMELLVDKIFFKDVAVFRVDKTYVEQQHATSLLEHDLNKLAFMTRAGRKEVREMEDIHACLRLPVPTSSRL